MTEIIAYILELFEFRLADLNYPFDTLWNTWLSIWQNMQYLIMIFYAEITIPIVEIETSLFELTFGTGLIVVLLLKITMIAIDLIDFLEILK